MQVDKRLETHQTGGADLSTAEDADEAWMRVYDERASRYKDQSLIV